MIHDIMPGTEEQLNKELTSAYVGIDPTADSLHIGHLVGVMMLRHLQKAGHRPIVLLGGATGMIGDPSMKSQERNLLDEKTLRHNEEAIKKQLALFLDFDDERENSALLVNNYDWMKDILFLDFIRDIGKHITVNYMMSKDSVKKRLSSDSREGLSFTEFTYQLVQGFDFLHLFQSQGCKLQMGGSDQWGNITTGTELIRRKTGGEAFALTCPLITRAGGGKFGKTESGNVWLNAGRTTPYAFYQFWLNTSDEDAEKYIRIFTLIPREEIHFLIDKHDQAPHLRLLQKRLAHEVTALVHGQEALDAAIEASQILFGKEVTGILRKLDEQTLLAVFDGVPTFPFPRKELNQGINIVDLLVEKTGVLPSKGEARRTIEGGGLSLNKEKVASSDLMVNAASLLNDKYLLVQKGKKNYSLLIAE